MKKVHEASTELLKLVLKLSDDRMKLFLDGEPSKPHPVTRDQLVAFIEAVTAVDPTHMGVVDDIAQHLSRGEKVTERRVARGKEAVPGLDGRLVFLVKKFSETAEPSQDARGFVAFRELNLFENITAGTVVARVYPPKNGTDGVDALGKAIPAKPGRPIKVQLDKTLVLQPPDEGDEKYERVIAQVSGYLVEDKGRLAMREELVIPGDVDFHTGNITFIGSVTVRGDVKPGFQVQAQKGITVRGSVTNAILRSAGGDVAILGSATGEECQVVCSGSFHCSVARQIRVEVVGSVTIEREAVDCSFRSQNAILSPKGRLVGGHSFAVCGVEAKTIGNDVGKGTLLSLCSDVEMTTEYATLVANIASHKKAISLVDLHLGPYAKNPARVSLLKPEYRQKMEQMLRKKGEIERSLGKLQERQSDLLRSSQANASARVNYLETLYDGVVVRLGDVEHTVMEAKKGPGTLEFDPEKKEFVFIEYAALECGPITEKKS